MRATNLERNTKGDAAAALYNNGYQRQYSGTRPTNVGDALGGGNVLLVECRYGATAFGASVNGVRTANAMTGGTAVATGTATFVQSYKSDGTTLISDMSIGLSGSGAEVITDRVALVAGDVVLAPSSVTITEGIGS